MVLHASSSLGGEGVQECRYAWGGHDAAERDGGASGVGYSLAVPYSYPLDYPETHNPLVYFAALRREKEEEVSGGDQLPTSGHDAPLLKSQREGESSGMRVWLPLWDPSLRLDSQRWPQG